MLKTHPKALLRRVLAGLSSGRRARPICIQTSPSAPPTGDGHGQKRTIEYATAFPELGAVHVECIDGPIIMSMFNSSRWIPLILVSLFLLAGGCGGCDETGSGKTGQNNQTSDAGEDVDATVDAEGDADAEQEEDCVDGQTRECGTDVGPCETGTQTCTEGQWGECEGEVAPQTEVCDGVDNDCNGVVDDDPKETLCGNTSSNQCDGVSVCEDGECVEGDPVDCSHLDEPCYVGVCRDKSGNCVQEMRPDGSSCEDGNFCTVGGTCNAGVCETSPRDCSGAGDQCNTGVCDAQAEECVPQPVANGTTCDDGLFCTVGDSCEQGSCTGQQRDCSGEDDQCNTGVCDESAGACVADPVADDTPCDDGQYCTVDDACQQGVCEGGGARSCSAAGGSCRTGTCDEAADECTGDPVADGTPCDDQLYCTVGDECVAGTCTAGDPRDCSAEDDQCNEGVCNESLNRCQPSPLPDTTPCDDGLFCTVNNTCSAGSCGGDPRDCSGEDDQCNTGICDESASSCVAQPVSDGTTCDDGQFCTVGDSCSGGACDGSARNCSTAGDQCNDGVCDESQDSCVPDPVADGTTCDDSLFCTVNDACTAGSCDGDPRDCSAAGDECNDGICDESARTCTAQPVADGTLCDDGLYCTVNTECTNGTCDGASRDCSHLDEQCVVGVCDEDADSCDGEAVTGGSCSPDPCDDPANEPVADAGTDEEVIPNSTVQLDGSGSSDPNGQTLDYDWTMVSRPSGSSATLSDSTAESPSFLGDVAGDYEVCLEVTNEDGCVSETDCVTITVKPQVDLHIELVWFSDDSDLDVHYRAPNGAWWNVGGNCRGNVANNDGTAVWFCVPNPDWGAGGEGLPDGVANNDPQLDVDNINGFGPENINQQVLFDGADLFRVGVHYFADRGVGGPVDGRIRVYVDGVLQFEETKTLDCQEFWEVADIDISGNGTTVAITSLNGQSYQDTTYGSCP
jgi:hypothetical protein